MTLSSFYNAIANRRRAHIPTYDEARRDYRRAQAAQHIAVFFGD